MTTRSNTTQRLTESASAGCHNTEHTMKNMTSGIHFDGKVFSYENEKKEQVQLFPEDALHFWEGGLSPFTLAGEREILRLLAVQDYNQRNQ